MNHSNDTKACEPTDSMAWGAGYWKPVSSENGEMRKTVVLSRCCFVTGIRGWGKPLSGRKESSLEEENVDIANNQYKK